MTTTETAFDQLTQRIQSDGVPAALAMLADGLREQGKYHELFEALKMQVRQRLGLPLLYNDSGDELDEPVRSQLEDGLLDACREVGFLLLDEGRVREGWMYLRPVGNRTEVADRLAVIEPNDDNVEELVEVCLHEGVDPARGFQLVLDQYGTCNAITTFESSQGRLGAEDQRAAAGLLVEHLHEELKASLVADIARQQGADPDETTIDELVANRPWLFGEYSYHIDTTHLASTVRFSRQLEDPRLLRLALDLTEYGRRLHQQFQYPGDEPFTDLYPSHALFLRAVLGEEIEGALQLFRERAEQVDAAHSGTLPIETYIQLLDRLGRPSEAVTALLEFAKAEQTPLQQLLPLLLDLSQKANDYGPLMDFCRERDDLLGFTTGLVYTHNQS